MFGMRYGHQMTYQDVTDEVNRTFAADPPFTRSELVAVGMHAEALAGIPEDYWTHQTHDEWLALRGALIARPRKTTTSRKLRLGRTKK